MILRSWEVEGEKKAEGLHLLPPVHPVRNAGVCLMVGTRPFPSFAHTGGKQCYEMAVFLPQRRAEPVMERTSC